MTNRKEPAPPGKIRYGQSRKASFKPRAEETQEHEYKSGGLPEMDRYSVDKK